MKVSDSGDDPGSLTDANQEICDSQEEEQNKRDEMYRTSLDSQQKMVEMGQQFHDNVADIQKDVRFLATVVKAYLWILLVGGLIWLFAWFVSM